MVRQVALVPAGCQPWNHDVVSSQGNRFAYSATLAIYIYELHPKYNEYYLLSIMSEHKKTITSICWCPFNQHYLASSSVDGVVIVWDVLKQVAVAKHTFKEPVFSIGWSYDGRNCLGIMNKKGPLWMWYTEDGKNLAMAKETQNYSSPVTVFRWHHEKHTSLAFGHEDGSISVLEIGSKGQKHLFKPEYDNDDDQISDPVVTLEWDPLSNDYLLICNKLRGVRLVDVPNQRLIMLFQLPSAASQVQTMAWIKNAPGMFITGDFKGGILRVWSVSNHLPIENIKIKAIGFHRLEVLNHGKKKGTKDPTELNQNSCSHISSTSQAKSSTITTLSNFTLPHAEIVCTFKDGGVGLYDLGHKKWIFLRDQGHIETIFDCKFKPDNPDHLATASFDGTIKIWDVTTMTCLSSSPGNEGIIYHISWAPSDLEFIAACTAKQGVFVWDVKKGKIIKRLSNHVPKSTVYCVSWNQIDSKLVMTCGADNYCIIQQIDGWVVQKYKHPGAVFGCDWSPFSKDMLATGCEDKALRVYYMSSSSTQPIRIFTGHEGKVFHIRWNPLKEGILCSGSDDGNIRVWDYTRDQCTCILTGHKAPVRGLTWNSEVWNLLASGSWDHSIRIWDTRDGACLHCILDHGADVYGLTLHPSRPFVLASSSRDSTVRLWSITSLIQPIELQILAGKPWPELNSGDSGLLPGELSSQTLAGQASKNLYSSLCQRENARASVLEGFSKFFSHPCGVQNLWDLVSVIAGQNTMVLSTTYSKGVVHRTQLTQFKASEAQQLEMIKMSKFGAGINAPTREERLTDAANIQIKLGNIERYCEIMVELGKWERALAIAPSVSMDYWQKLNQRYCKALIEDDSEDCVPFNVAAGNVQQLTSYFSSRSQLADAVLVAQSASEGSIRIPKLNETFPPHDQPSPAFEELTVQLMEELSESYFYKGSPVLAACCHLAVDDQTKAVSKLIRGNELELALCIGLVLNGAPSQTDIVLELLSRRCEALGKWDLGLDLLKLQKSPSCQQAMLCARCSSSLAEINLLHQKAGLPTADNCLVNATSLKSSPSDTLECVKFYLLSSSAEEGLILGLQYIHDKMKSPSWALDDIFPMIRLLGCIKTEKLQHSKYTEKMHELLALSAYTGALISIKREYYPIIQPLFQHARTLIIKGNLNMTLTEKQVEESLNIYLAVIEGRLTDSTEQAYEQLLHHCGRDPYCELEPGPDYVASSHLPSHSDIHVSLLSGERIRGQPFFLEDGRSVISLNEALMWATVNAFSPLGSGVRINPF
ncbi:WD repeat-containing protein 17 [Bulinus truncatus]|nr:WD repeat-containing protein 17 [Bulinus truncatus]